MPTPRPFTIDVPDEALVDLRMRLDRTRWPDENPATDIRAFVKQLR